MLDHLAQCHMPSMATRIYSANTPYICNYRSTGSATQAALSGTEQTMTATSGADAGAWFGSITDSPNLSVGAMAFPGGGYEFGTNGAFAN